MMPVNSTCQCPRKTIYAMVILQQWVMELELSIKILKLFNLVYQAALSRVNNKFRTQLVESLESKDL